MTTLSEELNAALAEVNAPLHYNGPGFWRLIGLTVKQCFLQLYKYLTRRTT